MSFRWTLLIFLLISPFTKAVDLHIQWPDGWQYKVVDRSDIYLQLVAINKGDSGRINQSLDIQAIQLRPFDRKPVQRPNAMDIKNLTESLREQSMSLTEEKTLRIKTLQKNWVTILYSLTESHQHRQISVNRWRWFFPEKINGNNNSNY
ncbi:hypothetical protein [uncultured Microbulbifer sp.]|uniref:hypothetical protein n=1 Tax=uncultured Microbulbifer sp. TaxID=348147 RepID=UPI0026156FB0|nr:hypothetical protein [uncultured Microbulbifer sp.]